MDPIRVLLADDHEIFRQGVRVLLEREGFNVVAEAGDGREAVRIAQEMGPDVAVLDLAMPILNGLEAGREIRQVSPGTRTILLTMHTHEGYVAKAQRAGIPGYVLKTQSAVDLVGAIQTVLEGKQYLSPQVSQAFAQAYIARHQTIANPLTNRERQVLQLVAEGNTTSEVAQRLGISVKTAESHRTRIMAKLDIHETAGLVRYAVRQGLIQP